jgi:hypothetical protein
MTWTRAAILLAFLAGAAPGWPAGQDLDAELETEIAKVDALATDLDVKLPLLHAMALDLGTHRNHLVLLKKQTGRTFARIYVAELRARGFAGDAIVKKLRALERRMAALADPEHVAETLSPVAYVAATVDHSAAGTLLAIHPEVGVATRRVALSFGVPVYRLSTSARQATAIGDAHASLMLGGSAGRQEFNTAVTLGAPTGDRSLGLGAGRVTVDVNGAIQRRFRRLRPFVTGGFTNSVFNNVGYQRPFLSNGNALYTTGGVSYQLHPRLSAGAGGFGIRALGDPTVIRTMAAWGGDETQMSPGRMPPGHLSPGPQSPGPQSPGQSSPGQSSPGMSPGMPPAQPGIAGEAPHSQPPGVAGLNASDHGFNGWLSWSVHRDVTLNLNVARSVPNTLTTVRLGLGFNLSHPFSRLLRR